MTPRTMPATSTPSALVETLARVDAFARSRRLTVYLVGGLLRDQLLGRPFSYLNVDLAVAGNAIEQARALAAHLQGAFVPLDEDVGAARVVVTVGDGESRRRIELDVCAFRGATIEEDLARRDFTVNAIAIPLGDWLRNPQHPAPLCDPLQGQHALAQRRLVACFPGTFEEDPVRILRAFRFAAQLGFALDGRLPELMACAAPSLSRVSGERLRDELLAICGTNQAGEAVASLHRVGALGVLLPELMQGRGVAQGGFHHLDVLEHELEAVRQADRILADFGEFSDSLRPVLSAYCAEELVERRARRALIKFGTLLHDVGKPTSRQIHPDGEIWFIGHEHTGAELAVGIVERWRFSNRESEMICQLVRHHLRPGFLSREPQLTRKALYRFYKDLGDHGPACALTWWADRLATRGPLSRLDQVDQQRARLEEILTPYFVKPEEVVRPPRLVDGYQLMKVLELSPGPVVGELLSLIEEAQAEGRVSNAESAIAMAREHLGRGHAA